MTTKTPKANYSELQVTKLILLFSACTSYDDCKELSQELEIDPDFKNKTSKMLLGKVAYLSRNGQTSIDTGNPELEWHVGQPLYTSKVYVTKAGSDTVRKSDLVANIAALLIASGDLVQSEVISSLESATKPALEILTSALTPKPVEVEEIEE